MATNDKLTRGLPFSADTLRGFDWPLKRVERRFSELLDEFSEADFEVQLDAYISFFEVCYSLRDWAVAENVLQADTYERLAKACPALKLCRDVAIRSKHRRLSQPSVAGVWSMGREYVDEGRTRMFLVADRKYDAYDVAASCIDFWRGVHRDSLAAGAEPPHPARSAPTSPQRGEV